LEQDEIVIDFGLRKHKGKFSDFFDQQAFLYAQPSEAVSCAALFHLITINPLDGGSQRGALGWKWIARINLEDRRIKWELDSTIEGNLLKAMGLIVSRLLVALLPCLNSKLDAPHSFYSNTALCYTDGI